MLDKSTAKLASLLAVGQQLREQFDEELEPAPEHLTARLNELEAGKPQSEPAAVRLAIINAVVRASVARRTATSSHPNGAILASPTCQLPRDKRSHWAGSKN